MRIIVSFSRIVDMVRKILMGLESLRNCLLSALNAGTILCNFQLAKRLQIQSID